MFLRLVADSFSRRPRHKLLTGAALALGMAVATAALSVSLDVGDRLSREFRSLGANLIVTPTADSLPVEIGGMGYRPDSAAARSTSKSRRCSNKAERNLAHACRSFVGRQFVHDGHRQDEPLVASRCR